MSECFECGGEAIHQHHVVPRSVGGTKTIPLCSECHRAAHADPSPASIKRLKETARRVRDQASGLSNTEISRAYASRERSRRERREQERDRPRQLRKDAIQALRYEIRHWDARGIDKARACLPEACPPQEEFWGPYFLTLPGRSPGQPGVQIRWKMNDHLHSYGYTPEMWEMERLEIEADKLQRALDPAPLFPLEPIRRSR